MGLHGAAALIPKHQGKACGLLENFPQDGTFFSPRAQGAVHILGIAQDQTLHAVLGDEGLNLRYHLLLAAGVYDRGEACQSLQTVGDGDAGVGIAVVDGHNFHGYFLSKAAVWHFFFIIPRRERRWQQFR